MTWQRVTIVGCGLIGASFALALRRSQRCERIAGWDSDSATLAAALKQGIIDEADQAFGSDRAVSSSDLIYLAMPVEEIKRFLRQHGAQVRSGGIITDAGSTKREVCQMAREFLPDQRWFVGGHPIAGSHAAGNANARDRMFEGAAYVLTTDNAGAQSAPLIAVRETLEACGARVVLMTAAEHDRAMALVSHLPQLLSSALAATVDEQADARALHEVSGAGFRDMTRLAGSSWSVWRDILTTNSEPIGAALDDVIAKLTLVRDELRQDLENIPESLSATEALFEKALRP